MISRRDFMKYALCSAALYSLDSAFPWSSAQGNNEPIDVNIPEYRLNYKGLEFKTGVGAPETPTPTGRGMIYEKLKRPVFRYNDPGPNRGKRITHYETEDGLDFIIPLEKMRSLGIRIFTRRYGLTTKYWIHSTVESWTIGKAAGTGCIRLGVEDMLELYPMVPVGTDIGIRYDTIKADRDGFTVFPDIYGRDSSTPEARRRSSGSAA